MLLFDVSKAVLVFFLMTESLNASKRCNSILIGEVCKGSNFSLEAMFYLSALKAAATFCMRNNVIFK